MKVRIIVTEGDILSSIVDSREGLGSLTSSCPVARAARRVFDCEKVSVGADFVSVQWEPGTAFVPYRMPAAARCWVGEFDQRGYAKPIEFTLEA
jgi:hypothetical protein